MKTDKLSVLFADISGSTQMYDTLGDTVALQAIGRCIASLSQVVAENNGRVVKTIGDEIMCTFPGADAAVLAAAAIQKIVETEFSDENTRIQVRIGIHHGKVVQEEGDIFGDTVNIAARLVQLANPSQILTSWETIDALASDPGTLTRDLGRFPIKGKREMMRVYEVLVQKRDPDLTLAPGKSFRSNMPKVYLRLRRGEEEVLLHEEGRTIQMGRDPEHEIVVSDKMASRNHACIACIQGKFVLEDQSTNGTFVRTSEGETVYLHREQLMLQGSGEISLGREFDDEPLELVQFYLHRM